jgi:hypothetical protein
LALDLSCPNDGTRYRRKIVELSHGVGLGMAILLLESLVEGRNGLLDIIDELSLILRDSATNFGSHKEGVKLGEHAEHLVCVLRCGQPITKPGNDGVFHS